MAAAAEAPQGASHDPFEIADRVEAAAIALELALEGLRSLPYMVRRQVLMIESDRSRQRSRVEPSELPYDQMKERARQIAAGHLVMQVVQHTL